MIYYYWLSIASKRNKDRQIEAEAEKNDDELKFYKQKVKHIQYEQQHDLTEAKTEGLIALKTAQDEHLQQERELLRDKRLLKGDCQKNEDNFRENVKLIKMVLWLDLIISIFIIILFIRIIPRNFQSPEMIMKGTFKKSI